MIPRLTFLFRPRVSRRRALARALDRVEASASRPLFVHDLTRATRVNERILRSIFREYFGVGPMRFLKVRQLREIRAALLVAHPRHDTVTRVAARFGIWDFALFARNYKALFGESPSATLRRGGEGSGLSWLKSARPLAQPAAREASDNSGADSERVRLPPGHLFVRVSKFLLNKTAYARYVEPTVLDMRHEHYEALQSGDRRLARWVIIRGYASVLRPFLVGIAKTIFRWFGS